MEIVTITSNALGYSLCPALYSVRLKSIESPFKVVVMLEVQDRSIDISTWQDIRVQQPILKFKVVTFNNPVQITFHSSPIKPMFTKVVVSEQTSFTFQSVEINKIKQSNKTQLYKLSLLPSEGYEAFRAFRKKVKKLQNLTSFLDWKISCRLRIVQNNITNILEIDDTKQLVIDLNQGPIRIQLEQLSWLSSPDDYMTSLLSDNTIGVTQSSEITFKFNQYLTLKFKFQKLSSSSTISVGLMSIRVLQSVENCPVKLTIKNPQPHVEIIHPLVSEQTSYFDLEYYYLQKNLEDTMSNSSRQSASVSEFKVFQQLRQLTSAFPNFPHIKNQILMPVDSQSTLTIQKQGLECTLRIFQLMDGLNSIRVGKGYVRFFVEFQPQKEGEQHNSLRMFKIKIADIWNIPSIRPIKLKILNNRNVYAIDLATNQKELKNLIYQNEFSKSHQITVKESNKTTIVTKSDKYTFTQLPNKNYYINESYSEEEVHFSLVSNQSIIYSGSTKLRNFQSPNETLIIPLQSMSKQNIFGYSYVKIQYQQIVRKSNSVKSLYKVAYSLQSKHHLIYQLKVTNVSSNKQYKKKITNTKPNQYQQTQFSLISPTEECQIQIMIRKHYLDEIANEYVHFELLNKRLHLNCNKSNLPQSLIRIKPNQYQIITQNLYDQEQGPIQLKFQITHIKQQFIDRQNHIYSMRIPKQFWQLLKQSFKNINMINFQILSSKKQKKSNKNPRSKQINYMDSSQFTLAQTDYRDSLAVMIDDTEVGYSKMADILTAKIQYPEKEIIFDEEGQWNLGILNVKETMVMFIYTFKEYHNDESDNESVKTVSKSKSKGKNKNKSMNLNKTMKLQNNIQLQLQINNLVQQNRMLVTKAVRLESNNTVLHQKIQELESIAKRQKMDLKFNQTTTHKRNPNQSKNAAKYRSVCACGATENLYIGYCETCIKQLEKTYGIVYKMFEEKASQYETIYFQKLLKKEKMQKLEKKVEALKDRLLMKQSLEDDESADTTQESSYHEVIDRIASLKNQIFTMSLKTKNSIDSSSILQQSLETKINGTTKNIFSMMQEIESYKVRMRELDYLIKEYKSK